MVVQLDAAVDIIHGVQHLAVGQSGQLALRTMGQWTAVWVDSDLPQVDVL